MVNSLPGHSIVSPSFHGGAKEMGLWLGFSFLPCADSDQNEDESQGGSCGQALPQGELGWGSLHESLREQATEKGQ